MKKLSKLFALILALCMVLSLGAFASGEPSGATSGEPSEEPSAEAAGDASVEDAFIEYIHEWLLNELANNSNMTIEQVEDEFMPLVREMNFVDFPAEMIYSGMLNTGVPMTFEEFAAQYEPAGDASGEPSGAPAAGGYTADEAGWKQYLKDYVSAVPAAQEHLDEFFAAIDAGEFYTMPGDMLFQDTFWGHSAATLDEFIAAGGQVEIPDFSSVLAPD